MKLTVLGGSAAGPNTGAGCAGFLIQIDDSSVVLDLGPGTLSELRKHIDYRQVGSVIITHYHVDHFLDLAAFRYLLSYNPLSANRKVPLYIPPGTRSRFQAWTAAFGDPQDDDFLAHTFNVHEINPERVYVDADSQIAFAPTAHLVPCLAVIVSDGNKRVGYTSDTGPSANLSSFFSGVTVLICENTEPIDTEESADSRGHLTPNEAGRLATEARAKSLLLTHRWEELSLDDAAEQASEEFDGPILIARPGLSVFV